MLETTRGGFTLQVFRRVTTNELVYVRVTFDAIYSRLEERVGLEYAKKRLRTFPTSQ